MCLRVKKNTRKTVAKEDIYVLKVAKYVFDNLSCISYYRKTQQFYNIELKSNLKVHSYHSSFLKCNIRSVEDGLHALININESEFRHKSFSIYEGVGIILCKIPIGSTYYLGTKGDIVSDRLLLIEPIVVANGKMFDNMENIQHPLCVGFAVKLAVKICKSHGIKIGL